MILRDFDIHSDDSTVERFRGGFVSQFHRETCCVSDLYCGIARRLRVDGGSVAKVVVHLFDVELTPVPLPADRLLINVLITTDRFDFGAYREADHFGKKLAVATMLSRRLEHLASLHCWDKSVIQKLNSTVAASLDSIHGMAARGVSSPCRMFSCRLAWRYDVDGVELTAVLFRRGSRQEFGRCLMGTAIPSPGCLPPILAAGAWTSPTTFSLTTPDFVRKKMVADFSVCMRSRE